MRAFELLPAEAAEFSVKAECLFAGQVFVEIGIFRQEPDCFAAPHFAAVAAEDFASYPPWRDETENNLQGSAFARSVRPEQAVNLAGATSQIQFAHRDQFRPPEGNRENLR